MKRRLSRRQFLRGLGGVTVSLPLLNSGLPDAFASGGGGATYPKRFIFMINPNGFVHEAWWPVVGASGAETDFQLNQIHEPLKAYKDRLLLLRNVNLEVGNWDSKVGPGEPHQKGMGGILTGETLAEGSFVGGDGSRTGWSKGTSIDQLLAKHIGKSTRFGSFHFGVRADSHVGSEVRSRVSYIAPGQPVPPINDPVEAFNQLFSDAMTDPGAMDTIKARRASVLDAVGDEFEAVRQRASYQDRVLLERHMDMVRDLEMRLSSEAIANEHCFTPDKPEEVEPDSETTMPAVARAQLDLCALALACDLTRVVTFQWSNSKNGIRFPWIDSLGDGHGLSHAGPSNAGAAGERVKRGRWYAQQLAYLLDALDAIPEGDGTVLDHSVVVWTSEISIGNTHDHRNLPILMAGDLGGTIRTGRYVQYAEPQSTNDLLVTLLNAFGLEEYERYGDSRFTSGPLTGII